MYCVAVPKITPHPRWLCDIFTTNFNIYLLPFSKSFGRQILCGQLDIFEQRDNALLDLTNANDRDYASKAQLFSQCVCSVDIYPILLKSTITITMKTVPFQPVCSVDIYPTFLKSKSIFTITTQCVLLVHTILLKGRT